MPRPEEYEVLILGSGKSGKHLAWHLAGSGYRTAVVERRWIGGACPNVNMLFRDAILAHPTMAEGLNALFATVPAAER